MLDDLTDVAYEIDNGLAWITINRPSGSMPSGPARSTS